MSATARKHEPVEPVEPVGAGDDATMHIGNADGTEYGTRGARGARSARPHLRMVSPLRPERASRGVFALVVTGLLGVGMVLILVINTSLAQGAFTISELQSEQSTLTQQEQTLSEQVAAAAAPDSLEQRARAMGMVPSETPVFLSVPDGRVLGKAAPAGGSRVSEPRLLTPADATATEAVDNASVGTDLPIAPGPDYDPAAADAAAAQAAAANADAIAADAQAPAAAAAKKGAGGKKAADAATGKKATKKAKNPGGENSLWSDSTVIDVTSQLSSEDSGLVAVPVN
jgi:hypothetical protein